MPRSAFAVILALLLGCILLLPRHANAQTRPFLDIVLLFDHSYSMFEHQDGRLTEAKAAAVNFINHLSPKYDRAGLVRFSENAEVQKHLGTPFADIKNKIQNYHADSFSKFTNLQNAIKRGREEITSAGARTSAQKFIILLSDGGINRPMFDGNKEDIPRAHSAAFDEAVKTRNAGVTIHAVIIGTDPGDQQILKEIAAATGGKSYFASSPVDLIPIYNEIAEDLVSEPLPALDISGKKLLGTAALLKNNNAADVGQYTASLLNAENAEEESEPTVPPVGIVREGVWDGELPEKPPAQNIASPLIIVLVAALFCALFGGAVGFAASRYLMRAKNRTL